MFLVDSADATADWEGVVSTIDTFMDRAGAEVISTRKWDDRRLCYEIDGRRRGTYVLTYFKAAPDAITGLERDVKLNDRILRMLVLRGDNLNEDRMNSATPLMKIEAAQAADAEASAPVPAPAPEADATEGAVAVDSSESGSGGENGDKVAD
jgi:small subunit ribosomal protein S6